ncbi:hypothetical protein [Fusobacterium sp. PH5-44]|uniref:hypothetical protein n=1 Tax=unclassified Fusobacterium TaxID=2648384 RepID=UPI003D1BF6AC
MTDGKKGTEQLTEVWGDTVNLKELTIATIIGIVLTMSLYFLGRKIFNNMDNIDKSLANGYSLLVGILGCFASGIISAKLFKPKRIVENMADPATLEDILKEGGMTLEDEIEALSKVNKEVIEEMEDVGLYSLLSLIPKDSPNYKPKYKEKIITKDEGKEGNL